MKFLAGRRRCFDLQMRRKAECLGGKHRCFDVSDLFFFSMIPHQGPLKLNHMLSHFCVDVFCFTSIFRSPFKTQSSRGRAVRVDVSLCVYIY